VSIPLRLCLVTFSFASGCSEAEIRRGGGPLVAFNSYVEPIKLGDGEPAYVAIVPGLQAVEVLRGSVERGFRAEVVAPPAALDGVGVPFPVAMTTADVSGDGILDILVFEPRSEPPYDSREPWLALGRADGGFMAVVWTDYLPRVTVYHQLTAVTLDASGRPGVVVADQGAKNVVVLHEASRKWTYLIESLVGYNHAPFVTRPAVVFPSAEWLGFQVLGSIARIPLSGPDTGQVALLKQLPSDYLIPFEAFDPLIPLEMAGCGAIALGRGLFLQEAGAVPPSLQVLRVQESDGTFTAKEAMTGVEVTTFVPIRRARDGAYLVGIIGRAQGMDMMQVASIDRCGEGLRILGSAPIDFSWRVIDAPPEHTDPIPRLRGVILAAREIEGGLEVVHYDGFDVRIFTATEADSWTPRTHRFSLHQRRTDASWSK